MSFPARCETVRRGEWEQNIKVQMYPDPRISVSLRPRMTKYSFFLLSFMKNKIILVTGGATGIGRACSEVFLKEGAKVVVNYLNSKKESEEIASKHPERVLAIQADMSEEADIKKLFDEVENKWGKVDIVVNNAGVVNRKKFPELDAETFAHTLKVDTIGPYLVSKEFALRKNGEVGNIVNIGSLRVFIPTTPDYSAAKAALHNLTISLAKAFAPSVRVNCVAPGFTETPMHEGNHDRLVQEAEKSLLKRYSQPEDIADAVLFLASEKAKSITGQILLVDNGRSFV